VTEFSLEKTEEKESSNTAFFRERKEGRYKSPSSERRFNIIERKGKKERPGSKWEKDNLDDEKSYGDVVYWEKKIRRDSVNFLGEPSIDQSLKGRTKERTTTIV